MLPSVEPGYLQELIPREAPQEPEKWQDVLADIERVIMPGVRGPTCLSFNVSKTPGFKFQQLSMEKKKEKEKKFLICRNRK